MNIFYYHQIVKELNKIKFSTFEIRITEFKR